MRKTSSRPFTILDGMILVVALAVGMALVRVQWATVSELGITGFRGNGVFDSKRATDELNELAKDGWRFRALITADVPAGGVFLERSR